MSFRKDHFNIFQRAYYRLLRPLLTDTAYADMSVKRWFGGGDVHHPQTFNEKLHWLKINDCNPSYRKLADKYAVRKFVEERVGEEFLNEIYGVWDMADLVEWSVLPDSFVVKATHGSGMNILVEDKTALDTRNAIARLDRWLATDYSRVGREWVYRDIPRRIIAERFLRDEKGMIPQDYKVFCFNGRPRYIQIDIDRFGEYRRAYFDTSWVRQPFTILHDRFDGIVDEPLHLKDMIELARILSSGITFVRVDFYALPRLVFGEMTFFPESGTGNFWPREWDRYLGDELQLTSMKPE